MEWEKAKFIASRDTVELDWLSLNIMCPTPIILDESTIRIYVAFCDEKNRGRVGFIDVQRDDPSSIKNISQTPCLDLGMPGHFDEDGVLPTHIFWENNAMYMYYCGFQKHLNIPYTSLLGLAMSRDGGNTFERVKTTPVLERIESELYIRTGAYCVAEDGKYKLFYGSGNEWFELYEGKQEPIYSLREIESLKKDNFIGNGREVIALMVDEYGITIPQYIEDGHRKLLMFSVRSRSRGYRLEYAEYDGSVWRRKGEIGIAEEAYGWYEEMQCFGKILPIGGDRILFFSGNHYGIGGVGWTRMKKES